MANRPHSDLITLWRAIEQAGGADAYIEQQLDAQGFRVQRRETDGMSKRALARYKAELKAEAAEKRALKKSTWLAYKATHIVHLGDGIFWNDPSDFDKWDLAEPEARAAENDLPPLDTPKQLADALGLSIPELRWLAYHREAATSLHYERFTIPKRSGGTRNIWAPRPKLKSAQRWILRNIAERLPVHGAAHGFLMGRSIQTNAAVHTDSKLILNVDLSDFFPTVSWRRIKGIFRKAGYREQVATLLALLCTEAPRKVIEHEGQTLYIAMGPRCLPQGAPTSPALTNTLCLRLDQRLAGIARSKGWRYTRYADDLTFSLPTGHKGPPQTGKLLGSVHHIARSEGFRVNPKKTRVSRAGGRQKVTGLVVNGSEAPRVPRSLRRQLRAAIHNLENGKPLREGESIAKLKGYAAFVYLCDPTLGGQMLKRLTAIESR